MADAQPVDTAPPAGTGPGTGRVARKRAERRRLVERTAAEVFAERGYEGANFEEIAARLDLRGASLYHYYASKEDLFLRAVENATAEVLERLRSVAAPDLPAEQRLRRLFREQAIIEVRDYPSFAPLFLMHVPVAGVEERLAELRRQHGAMFRAPATEVAAAHGIDRSRAQVSVFLALGSLAYLRNWYRTDGAVGLEEMAERVAEELVRPFTRPT